ncbi:MAG: hypothetical protein NVS4B11_32460 [Ktedonobacteraceae bacterium]
MKRVDNKNTEIHNTSDFLLPEQRRIHWGIWIGLVAVLYVVVPVVVALLLR